MPGQILADGPGDLFQFDRHGFSPLPLAPGAGRRVAGRGAAPPADQVPQYGDGGQGQGAGICKSHPSIVVRYSSLLSGFVLIARAGTKTAQANQAHDDHARQHPKPFLRSHPVEGRSGVIYGLSIEVLHG